MERKSLFHLHIISKLFYTCCKLNVDFVVDFSNLGELSSLIDWLKRIFTGEKQLHF